MMPTNMNSIWMWLRKQKCPLTYDPVEAVSLIRETNLALENLCLFT